MKIYELKPDVNHYRSFGYVNDGDDDLTTSVKYGEPLESWQKITIRPDDYRLLPEPGDYPSLLGTPMVSDRAKSILMKECDNVAFQFLDAVDSSSKKIFYLMNVLTKVAALDREKTVFEYHESRLLRVEKYHFRSDIPYPPVFKCYLDGNQAIYREVFVTDEFRQIVEGNKIKGFLFKELWDSDETRDRRFDWTIKKRKADHFLISGTIFVNGVGPYPTKKCVLSSEQIPWLCSELRRLKPEDIKEELNKLHFATGDCDLYVSIAVFDGGACIVLNPLWRDKKMDRKDNMQLPLSLKDATPVTGSIEPFLRDLERHIQLS